MEVRISDNRHIQKLQLLFCIVLVEYSMFIFSGVSFTFLAGNPFFSLEADPATWLFYLAGIPQFITSHQWAGIIMDISTIASMLYFIWDPLNNRIAGLLFLLLLTFYVTLMGHLVHHNFQFGYCLVFIPFLFRTSINRQLAFEATRYFLLFFYVSAAFLKIKSGSLADTSHFSHLISGQFTPYFLEGNTGFRTSLNLYLASHSTVSYLLFIASVILELAVVVGFFTRRYDKWIAVFILLFHFTNWVIMDIAPIGQVAFVCMLFLSKDDLLGRK